MKCGVCGDRDGGPWGRHRVQHWGVTKLTVVLCERCEDAYRWLNYIRKMATCSLAEHRKRQSSLNWLRASGCPNAELLLLVDDRNQPKLPLEKQ
jgi:hypothetical protein